MWNLKYQLLTFRVYQEIQKSRGSYIKQHRICNATARFQQFSCLSSVSNNLNLGSCIFSACSLPTRTLGSTPKNIFFEQPSIQSITCELSQESSKWVRINTPWLSKPNSTHFPHHLMFLYTLTITAAVKKTPPRHAAVAGALDAKGRQRKAHLVESATSVSDVKHRRFHIHWSL